MKTVYVVVNKDNRISLDVWGVFLSVAGAYNAILTFTDEMYDDARHRYCYKTIAEKMEANLEAEVPVSTKHKTINWEISAQELRKTAKKGR